WRSAITRFNCQQLIPNRKSCLCSWRSWNNRTHQHTRIRGVFRNRSEHAGHKTPGKESPCKQRISSNTGNQNNCLGEPRSVYKTALRLLWSCTDFSIFTEQANESPERKPVERIFSLTNLPKRIGTWRIADSK